MTKPTAVVLLSGLMTLTSAIASAQPVHDISRYRHPNLAAAQRATDRALVAVRAAQTANEFDLGGHAAHAMQLLDQANQELKAAAMTSNRQHMMGHP